MAPNLYNSLKVGGYCILSGFVEEQEEWVIKSHTDLGLKLIKIYKKHDIHFIIKISNVI